MSNRKYIFIAALLLAACTSDPMTKATPEGVKPEATAEQKLIHTSAHAEAGSLLVYFDEDATEQVENNVSALTRSAGVATRSGLATVDEVLASIGAVKIERVFPYAEKFEAETRAAGLHRWYEVVFDKETDLDEAALGLAAIADVSRVQFNVKMECSDSKATPVTINAATRSNGLHTFDDPGLPMQWHYYNTGDKGFSATARAGADVNAPAAWELTGGDPSVIVAIVDQGVKYTHPDLADNMWINTKEIPGNGIDDDGNGYVDDVYGLNFVTGGPISWDVTYLNDKGQEKGDSGHGTHVAGTVAAINNNGIGVSGVAGGTGKGDGVKLMSCQVFTGENKGQNSGSAAVVARAIKYAADMGASIIQCSFGYPGGAIPSDAAYVYNFGVESQAIEYFRKHKPNCAALTDGNLVIFAAGNDSQPVAGYPGAYRDYIAVTAIGPDRMPAYYTNYGPGSNIAAPGGDYKISTDPEQTSAQVLSTVPSELYGSDYGAMQGTSMACPHVSGVAALGLSYAIQQGKSFTTKEFNDMILTSVNDIEYYLDGTKDGMSLYPYRQKMGTGSIDAYQLLLQIEGSKVLRVPVGTEQLLLLNDFFGGGAETLKYLEVKMSADDMNKLGIVKAPEMKYGKLSIFCTKPGTAKITVSAVDGNGVGSNSQMGGMKVTKEIPIVASSAESANGGWL